MNRCEWCGCEWVDKPGCDCDERIHCDRAGQLGHGLCGICPVHNLPRFKCMCTATLNLILNPVEGTPEQAWQETASKVLEAAFCEHKEMVATGYADLAWRCAKCGYVYGTL